MLKSGGKSSGSGPRRPRLESELCDLPAVALGGRIPSLSSGVLYGTDNRAVRGIRGVGHGSAVVRGGSPSSRAGKQRPVEWM